MRGPFFRNDVPVVHLHLAELVLYVVRLPEEEDLLTYPRHQGKLSSVRNRYLDDLVSP